ncbi:MAG TPA: MFS transporter [Ktedonobacteraceae bacterium]|nr:MFS transporter [Ktedonobacteraceae bacterium]
MKSNQQRVARNIALLYITNFLSNFRLNAPILILYLQQQTGSFTAAMSLLSCLMIGASLLDIPTGALADLVGRKTSIVLGWFFGLLHLSLMATGGSYALLLLSMLMASAGMALGSGANTAMLYDSLVELQRESEYKKVSGRVNGLLTLALGIAALFGSSLATISLSLPFWVQLLPQCLGLLLTFFLAEPAYHKPFLTDDLNLASGRLHSKSSRSRMIAHSFQAAKVILENKQLLLLLLLMSLSFAVGETVAVIIPQWYQSNMPLVAIGFAFTGAYVASALGSFCAAKISARFGDLPILFISILCSFVITMSATFLTGPIAVAFAVSVTFFYGVRWPILDFLINRQVASSQRATIGSFGGVLQRSSYAIIALAAGILTDKLGVAMSMQCLMLLLGTGIFLLLLLKPTRVKALP